MREPTPHEVAALQSLTNTSHIGMMPVKFNGQERYAIIIIHQGPKGPYVQVVGILPDAGDELIDPQGNKSENTVPGVAAAKPN